MRDCLSNANQIFPSKKLLKNLVDYKMLNFRICETQIVIVIKKQGDSSLLEASVWLLLDIKLVL